MKNIHILATSEASRLGLHDGVLEYAPLFGFDLFDKNKNFRHNPINIYITDNSEIKVGDWLYYKHFGEDIIDKANENTDLVNLNKPDRYFKKIILTNNETLIKQGVQMVGDDFLQWFCNNQGCEYVEIEKGYRGVDLFNYKIILPQEKVEENVLNMVEYLKQGLNNAIEKSNPLFPNYETLNKQETLEDVCGKILNYLYPNCKKEMSYLQYNNAINALKCISDWQKQQDASRYKEDMNIAFTQGWFIRERFDDLVPDIVYPKGLDMEEKQDYAFDLWFEKFKKDKL